LINFSLQRHQIDVQEYCTRYLKNSGTPSAAAAASTISPKPEILRAVFVGAKRPPAVPPLPLPPPQPASGDADLMGRVFSDNLEEMALVVCRYCQQTMAPRKLLRHIRTDHGILSRVSFCYTSHGISRGI
jgi:hypothetical protein